MFTACINDNGIILKHRTLKKNPEVLRNRTTEQTNGTQTVSSVENISLNATSVHEIQFRSDKFGHRIAVDESFLIPC